MRYFLGIDQSQKSTGVVLIDSFTEKVDVHHITCDVKLKPDDYFNDNKSHFSRIVDNVDYIVDKLDTILYSLEDPDDTVVGIEALAMGGSNSPNVVYMLGHLFASIIGKLKAFDLQVVIIGSPTWKKVIFQEDNKSKLDKNLMYELYWEKAFKRLNQYDITDKVFSPQGIIINDLRDAFCIAHTTRKYVELGAPFIDGTQCENEALKSLYCQNVRQAKLCWKCPFYNQVISTLLKNGKIKLKPLCLKPAERTKVTRKKDQQLFEEGQENNLLFF